MPILPCGRGMQEVFWADFLTNHKGEFEGMGCAVSVGSDFGLQVVDTLDFYGDLRSGEDGSDWFGFEYGVRLGGEKVNLLPCLIRYLESRPSGATLETIEKWPARKKIPIETRRGRQIHRCSGEKASCHP